MASGPIIVTGAAGALGRAAVAHLSARGLPVVAIDVGAPQSLPSEAAFGLGGVDLTDEAGTARAFAAIGERYGSIAGLVNIAGGFAWETIGDGETATWDRLYAINVKTALHASRAALPLMDRGGAIVTIGAGAAARAEAGMGAYAASKSAVARLTEALAAELKGKGIRVNAVLPSIIDTPANRANMPEADFGKWVTVEELANVIAFLVSDEASGVTGAAIAVNGRV
jgi:NAD(P)-dependent dehydrogenase (short-subunit alcohol dehydrogenase family)